MKRQILLLLCSAIILSVASQVIADTLIADDFDGPQFGILAPVSWFMYPPNTRLGQIVINGHKFLAFDYGRKPDLINSTGGFVVELEVSEIADRGWAGISIGRETIVIEQCELGLIIQSDMTTDKKDRFFSRGQGLDIDTEYIQGQKIRIVITTDDVGTTGSEATANIYFGDTLVISNFRFQWDRGPTYLCLDGKPRAYFDNLKISQAEPAVEFASAYSAAKESDSPVFVDVILKRPRAGWSYAVDYDLAGSTAANGEDFILSSSSLTFEPGQTKKTIAIPVINDSIDEFDETVKIKLKNPKGEFLYIGPNRKHTHTIIGSSPLVTFDKASTRVREDAGRIEIPVSLSHTCSKNVTINYEVSGGNAENGTDYKVAGSRLRFTPGQVTQNIVINIIDDTDSENSLDETLTLTLNSPQNARLGKITRHRCGIIDNEPGIEFDRAVWIPMINKLSLRNGRPLFFINDAGHLEWQPTYAAQLTVKLPEKDLSDPGDIVEYKWLFKGEGTPGGSGLQNLLERWGSGDFRWGVYDSNGKPVDTQVRYHRSNDIFKNYFGYHFRSSPHVPPNAKAGSWGKRSTGGTGLLSSWSNKMNYFGNGHPIGQFAPLIIRLERKDSKTVILSVTQNGVTQTFTDDDPNHQPKKIDAMAINFPNPRAFKKVVLAIAEDK